VIGAACGFITYWVGAFFVAYPDLSAQPRAETARDLLNPFQKVTVWELLTIAAASIVGFVVARYKWRPTGVLSYVGLFLLIVGYVVYSLTVSIPRVPASQRWLSYALVTAETGGLLLFFLYSFYSLDASTRRRWTRVAPTLTDLPDDPPRMAFLVPVYNEPVEMVEQTLAHMLRQEYPRSRYVIVVADDSTNAAARHHLQTFCEDHRIEYLHRKDRTGYKAGALNAAVRTLPPEVEFLAVVDADYWIVPSFLRSVVGHFSDARLGFVQTPQDYRNVDESFLTRQYKQAESYFYHAVMPSRNEENTIIFCCTMGVLRRAALEEVGGFAEDQICEDAELSVRLAAWGWTSLYVDRSFGRGLVPPVFEAYQKQFSRWAFGNVRILLTRTGTILRSKMRLRQKFDFIFSNLHWFDGFFVFAISLVLLALGLGPFFGRDLVTHHQRELALVGLIPILLLFDSLLRLLVVLRKNGTVRPWASVLVQGMWFAIKMTSLKAVLRCLFGRSMPFVRTPKESHVRLGVRAALLRAVATTKLETTMAFALLGVGVLNAAFGGGAPTAILFLTAWLMLFSLFFLTAPLYAYLSYRTLKPMSFSGTPIPAPSSQVALSLFAA
jgi:cellulose synthase/poly-beta-1,6-N-acetylglucosamine synthase-like glycosyltransferase